MKIRRPSWWPREMAWWEWLALGLLTATWVAVIVWSLLHAEPITPRR